MEDGTRGPHTSITIVVARILGLTSAVGIAGGIIVEFQLGTNQAKYPNLAGDFFGMPPAAKGVFAFFLESGVLRL